MLCAFFYSRYITRPIVRMSDIAGKMAELDFHWECGETRRDEIGQMCIRDRMYSTQQISPELVGQIREIEGIKECSATVEGLAAFPSLKLFTGNIPIEEEFRESSKILSTWKSEEMCIRDRSRRSQRRQRPWQRRSDLPPRNWHAGDWRAAWNVCGAS